MSNSLSVTPDSMPPQRDKPVVLDILPGIELPGGKCSPKMQQQIDLLLLGIEALDLRGAEVMLQDAQDLQLQEIISNRVALWRLRTTNPWRRSYKRSYLTTEEAKALVVIIGNIAKRLNVTIRQLLFAEQQMREKGLPFDNHFRLSEYLERFRVHFSSRMNQKRTKVSLYLADQDELNELALSILKKLLFASGTMGIQRIWVSLCDGEIAE